MASQNGALRLFRVAGIQVFLHWTWFILALFELQRTSVYSSFVWNGAEYLALFAIVLLHELGHALACRQVGGEANTIVLWPLGGVAFVSPPQRPGATLWSVAAGPLVNVVLAPPLVIAYLLASSSGLATAAPDAVALLNAVAWINGGLFIFNVLPIYPLDGGQILRSLLWYVLGRARSLMAATAVGFVGLLVLAALAFSPLLAGRRPDVWLLILVAFLGSVCWNGFREARRLSRAEKLPRRPLFACPSCRSAPAIGAFWRCAACTTPFDIFETLGVCPSCNARFAAAPCGDCGRSSPITDWQKAQTAAPVAASIDAPPHRE